MGAFPEIAERLALHDLEQRVVRQRRELRWIARRSRARAQDLRGRRAQLRERLRVAADLAARDNFDFGK